MEQCIIQFMQKNNEVINSSPIIPNENTTGLRYHLIQEEVIELLSAIDKNDIIKIADGIADSLVVIIGTAISYGLPVYDIFLEAHRANMSKNGPKNEYGKVTKGDGYNPPNFESILRSYGWKNEEPKTRA